MLTTLMLSMLAVQLPDAGDDLAAILVAERERVEVMDRAAPAVCSVMSLSAPGGGSGVIFDPAGFVLTNFHVVGKPDVVRMKVGLPDGNLYGATVLGVDPGSDLAVLLLDARDGSGPAWPAAELGDSDALLVGEQVFAMGNPFLLASDFRPTTTWGIVSGTHRYQPGQGNRALVYPDCIQVDVPINPGNSGGPLFAMDGRVVGINGRISIQSQRGRVNVGVGFAIAANQVRNFLPDLMAGRFAEHGTLDLNAWFMEQDGRRGVYVQSLFADSTITDFGVGLGDELTTFNGEELRSANQLATRVGVLPAGTWVRLGFRSQLDDGSFGAEQVAEFPLRRLDTGSSQHEDRVARDEHRRLALTALARHVGAGEPADGATLRFDGPDGRAVTLRRRDAMLRVDTAEGDALVRRGDGDGFRIAADGTVATLTAEEDAKLARILAANPFLWRGPQQVALIRDGVLDGGVMVGTAPGFRVRLPGDGQLEVWFLLDGRPGGCRYRDPVQAAMIELRADGAQVVKDGQLQPGWRFGPTRYDPVAAGLFERPAR